MFFVLSKVLWFLANPGNVLLIVLIAGTALLWTRWRRFGRALVAAAVAAGLFLAVVPVGSYLVGVLEDRFPVVSELPASIDGIVVLGGVVDPVSTRLRGQIAVGSAVERILAGARLAKRYPGARVVYSAGSPSLIHTEDREARIVAPLFSQLGVDPARVMVEDTSRNTAENAAMSQALMKPAAGETWLLVTSAFHMPRAVGVFRKIGWPVLPYPVDYITRGGDLPALQFNFAFGIGSLGNALHEWLGLAVYWATGRTDTLFPAPDPAPAAVSSSVSGR